MAPRTLTRRKGRQNSDEIEDARPTQDGNMEEVSDDDHQPRRAKIEKKGKGKQRAVEPEEDDGDGDGEIDMEDSDDEDRIDVANFPDQPLLKDSQLSKLKGISDDWDSMRKMIGQRSDIYKDVAAAMAEAGETDMQNSKALLELDRGIKEFIDVGEEMRAHSESLGAIYQKIARGERIDNALELYEEGFKERVDAYASKTARQKYGKDERYHEFHSSIWEVTHHGEAMPPVTDFIEKEENGDSDSDEDIQVGGVTQNFTCPITLTTLVDPVTSRVCKHSFSRDAIKELCRDPRREIKCPASGCNQKFRFADCLPDESLAKKVRAHERRVKAAARDSDAEAIDSDAEEVEDD
ncbi:zinc-finger of the MIZ type in Nse subunit-domain-containing protein [Crepidotus variabilis]|uniref:Zinc-finger of the MIZ type in Nse subunit-domain-containing protein n=1 Tax=Crepidotus variabilis TaxID=179855 RepID=A0A9P6JPG5_9AGAR|nr:zinc-finger of the MIZ type in Nse subunit-domain-containing protein [Crepidotus variabilis]